MLGIIASDVVVLGRGREPEDHLVALTRYLKTSSNLGFHYMF